MQTTTYYTLYNGRRPFRVVIERGDTARARVYHITGEESALVHELDAPPRGPERIRGGAAPAYESVAMYDREVGSVFVGKSPVNEMTVFSGGHGPHFDGNSVLLAEADGAYVFVGESAFRFRPDAPVVEFVSPVGNNAVPYPYALDASGTAYVFLFSVKIPRWETVRGGLSDPNDWYLARTSLTARVRCPQAAPPRYAKYRDEEGHEWILDWCPPEELQIYDYEGHTLETHDGAVIRLTNELVGALMRSHAERNGFAPLAVDILAEPI